jgi:hypothetical protein
LPFLFPEIGSLPQIEKPAPEIHRGDYLLRPDISMFVRLVMQWQENHLIALPFYYFLCSTCLSVFLHEVRILLSLTRGAESLNNPYSVPWR